MPDPINLTSIPPLRKRRSADIPMFSIALTKEPALARGTASVTELQQQQMDAMMRSNILQLQIMNSGEKVCNTRRIISRSQFNKLKQKKF